MGCYNDRIALKFDMHIGSTATAVSVKLQSDWRRLNPNRRDLRLREILW